MFRLIFLCLVFMILVLVSITVRVDFFWLKSLGLSFEVDNYGIVLNVFFLYFGLRF